MFSLLFYLYRLGAHGGLEESAQRSLWRFDMRALCWTDLNVTQVQNPAELGLVLRPPFLRYLLCPSLHLVIASMCAACAPFTLHPRALRSLQAPLPKGLAEMHAGALLLGGRDVYLRRTGDMRCAGQVERA